MYIDEGTNKLLKIKINHSANDINCILLLFAYYLLFYQLFDFIIVII
jgi:hypothetical protein